MYQLSDPTTALGKIGAATASKLKRLDIETLHDLVWSLPKRYEDLSAVKSIADVRDGDRVTVKGIVKSVEAKRSFRKRITITELALSDSTGDLRCTWFGRRFIEKALQPGDEIFISGKANRDLLGVTMINPVYEKAKDEQIHTAGLIPYYQVTEGVTQKQLRFLIQSALKSLPPLDDAVPPAITRDARLMPLDTALRQVHAPKSMQLLGQAVKRLKFEELFWMQLTAGYAKRLFGEHDAPAIPTNHKIVDDYIDGLPFELTADQKIVSQKILSDLEQTKPTHRLIQGDVGSGKTVVASIAILNAVQHSMQAALMAPTELLAVQHYHELANLFKDRGVSLALLTGKHAQMSDKAVRPATIVKRLADGAIQCIVGTHSLIQQRISAKNLGLIVIDEQHRFGVGQRKRLAEITQSHLMPHLITLTATPIPRTLALTLYGDLDISTIKEKPAGRKPIITKLVDEANRQKAYDFIAERIKKKQQVFVLCPLIEGGDESDVSETASVMREHERLSSEIYPNLEVRLVHGKLKADEKKKILQDFRDNKFPILVTTSVIEVGIDIPNATCMVIEGAERFGLAQLHQFRGRVGRSDLQSYCLLFSKSTNPATRKRLNLLIDHDDGFELAEADLKMRGEGELFGTKQSGLVNFKIATIHDTDLIELARKWVDAILSDTKHDLWNEAMRERLERAEEIHLE